MSKPLQDVTEYLQEATTAGNAGAYQIPLGAPLRARVSKRRDGLVEIGGTTEPFWQDVTAKKQ